jgi:hypothetical protein
MMMTIMMMTTMQKDDEPHQNDPKHSDAEQDVGPNGRVADPSLLRHIPAGPGTNRHPDDHAQHHPDDLMIMITM